MYQRNITVVFNVGEYFMQLRNDLNGFCVAEIVCYQA